MSSISLSVCTMVFGFTSLTRAFLRKNDDSKKTGLSPKLAWNFVFNGVVKVNKPDYVRLKLSLKKGVATELFLVSQSRTSPLIVLQLNTGRCVTVILTFFTSHGHIWSEEVIIYLPVLRHTRPAILTSYIAWVTSQIFWLSFWLHFRCNRCSWKWH